MELAFKKVEESGWRGRGAPRREVPPHIVQMLTHAAKSGEVGVISADGDSEEDVKAVLGALRAGARHINRRIRIQRDDTGHCIRFRLGGTL